jgi:hypothetical protein
MLTGKPPFSGSIDVLREKHLHETPAKLDKLPDREAGFVLHMLRKASAARPTLKRCMEMFSQPIEGPSGTNVARSALAEAGRKIAEEQARAEAIEQAEDLRLYRRDQLRLEALSSLKEIRSSLFAEIRNGAESAEIEHNERLILGKADLKFRIPHLNFLRTEFERWDVITHAQISLSAGRPGYSPYIWSASVLFARMEPDDDYRWYEVAFFDWGGGTNDPHAEPDGEKLRANIASSRLQSTQVAYGPLPIDAEDESLFSDRWQALVAKAALGKLERPRDMPVNLDWLLRRG